MRDNDDGEGYKFYDKETHLLKRCDHSENARYMREIDYNKWYNDPICFNKSEKIEMKSSWWYPKFVSPVIMITQCEDTKERL